MAKSILIKFHTAEIINLTLMEEKHTVGFGFDGSDAGPARRHSYRCFEFHAKEMSFFDINRKPVLDKDF